MTLRNGSITMVYQTITLPGPANATPRVPAHRAAADAQRHVADAAINLRNGELAGLPTDMAQVLQAHREHSLFRTMPPAGEPNMDSLAPPTLTLVKFDNGVSLREQILRNARSPNGGA
jgi:hypothetical protein